MSWLRARRQRAELVRVVTADVERARVVLGRLLLIRSVAELRALCGPDKVRDVFPDWTYLPVAAFFVGCPYRTAIAVPPEEDRAIARELGLVPHLDLDRDLTDVRRRLRTVVGAYFAASASFNVTENYQDPDLPFDEQASVRRYADLDHDERKLNACLCALPDDLPGTAVGSPALAAALPGAARRMGGRELGYSPYATTTGADAERWPQWLATALVRRRTVEAQPVAGATLASLVGTGDGA